MSWKPGQRSSAGTGAGEERRLRSDMSWRWRSKVSSVKSQQWECSHTSSWGRRISTACVSAGAAVAPTLTANMVRSLQSDALIAKERRKAGRRRPSSRRITNDRSHTRHMTLDTSCVLFGGGACRDCRQLLLSQQGAKAEGASEVGCRDARHWDDWVLNALGSGDSLKCSAPAEEAQRSAMATISGDSLVRAVPASPST